MRYWLYRQAEQWGSTIIWIVAFICFIFILIILITLGRDLRTALRAAEQNHQLLEEVRDKCCKGE